MNKARGRLLLLAATLALGLGAVELYLRATSPFVIRRNTPAVQGKGRPGSFAFFVDSTHGRRLIPGSRAVIANHPDSGLDVPIRVNAHGFRDDEIPAAKDPREVRILVLGDSITWAEGFPREMTFVERAEACLNGEGDPRHFSVINAGVAGVGLADEVDLLEEQGLAVQPDAIVVDFFLNDSNPPDGVMWYFADPGLLRRHSLIAETLYRRYAAWQFRRGQWQRFSMYRWISVPPPPDLRTNREALLWYAGVASNDWGAAWSEEGWVKIELQLRRLEAIAKQHDIPVFFVAFPLSFQVQADYVEDGPQRQLAALCRLHGFGFLDLLPALRAHRAEKLHVDWCHLAGPGHERVAGELCAFLRRGLPPAAGASR